MTDTDLQQGGCLCGEIRYSVKPSTVLSTHNCHCKDCQKSTGSGYTTFFLVTEADFNLLEGKPKSFEKNSDEGHWIKRSFCPNCGSPIFSACQLGEGLVFIKAGSLDESNWLTLVSSFWGQSARSWAPAIDSHPVCQKNT